jgi:hypothetical protein
MTNQTHNSEPAFPLDELNHVTGHICAQHFGLTVRDYFAAKALGALIGHQGKDPANCGKKAVPTLARYAYEYADEMLKARQA